MGFLYMVGALSLPWRLAANPLEQECAYDVPDIFLGVQKPELPHVILQYRLTMVRLFRQLPLPPPYTRTRPVAMGWHGVPNATPGQQDAIFLPPLRIFLQFFCCFIFVANEKFWLRSTLVYDVGLCIICIICIVCVVLFM